MEIFIGIGVVLAVVVFLALFGNGFRSSDPGKQHQRLTQNHAGGNAQDSWTEPAQQTYGLSNVIGPRPSGGLCSPSRNDCLTGAYANVDRTSATGVRTQGTVPHVTQAMYNAAAGFSNPQRQDDPGILVENWPAPAAVPVRVQR